MNTHGYANRWGNIVEILKTVFEGVVFAGVLVTLCAWMFVLDGLIQ